jgi:peptide/nickel transport system ATP-binding protein
VSETASQNRESEPLLQAAHVSMQFIQRRGVAERIAGLFGADRGDITVTAVSHVDLTIGPGEVVGLVGESGCGKSTLGRIVAGLLPPTQGRILIDGIDRSAMNARQRRAADLGVQMVFQDPSASLNPRMRVRDIICEAPRVHGLVTRGATADTVATALRRVGLDPSLAARYPHQFSGGQRQRIGIARALAVNPRLLVCDESVASLDVSIQAQILNLFMALRAELGLAYLFISHDLGVVEHVSDRVAVMYLGRVVEEASTEALFAAPNHPYTQALLAEAPHIAAGRRAYRRIAGEIPSPLAPPPGCHFHPRCPYAMPVCRTVAPPLLEIAPGRRSACHLNATPAGV